MVFGDIQSIAIECKFLRNHNLPSPGSFGHISIWAGGHRVGHFNDVVMLSQAAHALLAFANNSGRRGRSHLFSDNSEEAMKTIFNAIFARYERNLVELEADFLKFAPFLVCPNGNEAFDGWIAILIEGTRVDRFIWKHLDWNVHEVRLKTNELNDVIRSFDEWLNNQTVVNGGVDRSREDF